MKAIVTRPRDDAAALVGALADRGVAALLAPMLTILPVPQATRHLAERLAGAQAVLFTSANGVRAFAAASPRRELPGLAGGGAPGPAGRPPRLPPGGGARGGRRGAGGAGAPPAALDAFLAERPAQTGFGGA